MRREVVLARFNAELVCVDAVDSNLSMPCATVPLMMPHPFRCQATVRWGNLLIGLVLGGVIGAGALYVTKVDPSLLSKMNVRFIFVPSCHRRTDDEEPECR
jgi:hypothetical protein